VLDVQLGLELVSVHEDWKCVKVAMLDRTLVPVLDRWLSSTSRHVEDALYDEHVVGLIGKRIDCVFCYLFTMGPVSFTVLRNLLNYGKPTIVLLCPFRPMAVR
jgi:hypothetical protein